MIIHPGHSHTLAGAIPLEAYRVARRFGTKVERKEIGVFVSHGDGTGSCWIDPDGLARARERTAQQDAARRSAAARKGWATRRQRRAGRVC